MGDTGRLMVAILISVPSVMLFALLAWKYWHGKWLASIAGNTFITKEETKLPAQRRLGKRVAVAMLICCFMVLAVLGISVGRFLGLDALYVFFSAMATMSVGILVAYLIWMFTMQWREVRAEQNKELAANRAHSEDIKLDRRATTVLIVIISTYLLIMLVVAPLAKS